MPTKITRPQMDDAMLERCIEAIPALVANPTRCPWCGLPLVDDKCRACFPPSQPSRDFLIRQAILNAVPQVFPISAAAEGVTAVLVKQKYVTWTPDMFAGSALAPFVLAEFRKLKAKHAA